MGAPATACSVPGTIDKRKEISMKVTITYCTQ